MASLGLAFGGAVVPASGRRAFKTAATRSSGGGTGSEPKGPFDWILGGMQKEDQLLETDPILKKVEESNAPGNQKTTVAVPKKNNGAFGGLFVKNE